MDVEQTIEFILQIQAKAEARMDRMEARIDGMEARFDRRLNALTKLVGTGMKMLVQTQKVQKQLAAAQKETDRKLRALLDSLRTGQNGR